MGLTTKQGADMALAFNKIEPVQFGDFTAMPKLDQELKLRLQNIKSKADSTEESLNLLAECFGDKADAVKEFMRENFTSMDYTRLRVYLLQGEKGLEDLERRFDQITTEEMKREFQRSLQEVAQDNG